LQYYLSDTVSHVIKSKDKNDWVFRPDYVILAFTISEKQYCKNSLFSGFKMSYINTRCLWNGMDPYWEYGRSQREQKILYHLAIFAIANELLIIKNRHISLVY